MRIVESKLYLLPVQTRVPLKFGTETLTEVTCARVRIEAIDDSGRRAVGWGETPLSVQWFWPSALPYVDRFRRLVNFCALLVAEVVKSGLRGHALEIGRDFQEYVLPRVLDTSNKASPVPEPMPWLAALGCFSAFDLAAHDAFGKLVDRPMFQTFAGDLLGRDLAKLIEDLPAFRGQYPADTVLRPRRDRLPVWHLVGGLDPLDATDLTGVEPDDGYPVLLRDWIASDGLRCLKVKLRGNDAGWDYDRLVRVGAIALDTGVEHLSADFNCTVRDPGYVNDVLDRLAREHPAVYDRILYVEQPFPYDLDACRIDVRGVAARKPLFLDESAHDWRHVRLGHELGWNGVALKTCKTLSGALLSACWAHAHGMSLMVQDLTNPMLAQLSHLELAAHLPTLMGVESNAMQFYPEASRPEAHVHPGAFRRRGGTIDFSTVRGPGLGYRLDEIDRPLPQPLTGYQGG